MKFQVLRMDSGNYLVAFANDDGAEVAKHEMSKTAWLLLCQMLPKMLTGLEGKWADLQDDERQ